MCGICGIYGPDAGTRPVDTMLSMMERRGPDGSGVFQAKDIVLGHRRLAIVDLSGRGRQPMVSEDEHIAISVNGEIYNYRELRAELEGIGYIFRSDCDSETVIHAWKAWGVGSFARFNGMFAIALYDRAEHALYLARDRMGIKPVYVWVNGETVVFASDMRAIVAASGRHEWALSATGFLQYLTYENRLGSETMLEGIRMVVPGEVLRFDASGMTSAIFADPLAIDQRLDCSFEDAVEGFKTIFDKAIARHLMSDVALASYLSAGVDSGLVSLTAANRLKGAGPAAFTGAFEQAGWYDEASGAALTAAAGKLPHHLLRMNAESFRDHFDALIYALEEPRMGTGSLPQYLVAQKVAETHKVVLTGHGGDELFSGYPVFKFVALQEALSSGGRGLVPILRSLRLAELPHIAYFTFSALSGRDNPFLPVLFGDRLISRLLRPEVSASLKKARAAISAKERAAPSTAGLIRQYIKDYLPGLLVVEDKISMAHGLESRTPFLDNELVMYSLSLLPRVKLEEGRLKAIPKTASRGLLPDQIFDMPKRGFPNPLSGWLRGPLSDWLRTRLCNPQGALTLLFDSKALEDMIDAYLRSWRRHFRPLDEIATHRIFMLLSMESFLRQYKEKLGVILTAPQTEEPR
jgi:asparagine synthase (glutamine-hydrolysing)